MESLRQTQAKCSELEKTNKKLYAQTHTDRKEIIKLREVSGDGYIEFSSLSNRLLYDVKLSPRTQRVEKTQNGRH